MKAINFIFISLFSLLFVCSCTKHDFDTYTPSQAKEHQYAKAFEQTFGNIASGQAWGFSQPKAYTRSAMPNATEWGTKHMNLLQMLTVSLYNRFIVDLMEIK